MAFDIKKTKRQPASTENEDGINCCEGGCTCSESDALLPQPQGNVVATQNWVYNALKKFWNWTKYFATESAQVAGGLKAGRIQTGQIQGHDIYATRLFLLDPNGKPREFHVDELGNLQSVYDFKNVFIYPQDGIQVRRFVPRYQDVASNFIGLTPYEILLNFVAYESVAVKKWMDRICPKFCEADGEEKPVQASPMLFTCPKTKKIVALISQDSDGNEIARKDLPEGSNFRLVTLNMPRFKYQVVDSSTGEIEEKEVQVPLPNGIVCPDCEMLKPFMPPFLKPAYPPYPPFLPPGKPVIPPGVPISLDNDIFSDEDPLLPLDDLFDDIDQEQTSSSDSQLDPNAAFEVPDEYEVTYDDYDGITYYNFAMDRAFFPQNQEQFFKVETEDA